MRKKGFIQISFPWLFAIIVGIAILFLAIYGVTKLIRTEQTIQDVKTSKEIGILLNPLEIGFESAKTTSLAFPVDTRMSNKCNLDGEFGRQLVQISQKSFNQWTDTNIDVGFSNKYFFSKSLVQGKEILVFAKPFNFPFKVADLIYLTSKDDLYCFIDAPEDVEEELLSLGQENILIENCSEKEDTIKVCFSGGLECDINVNTFAQSIEKRQEKVYYEGDALMYAGIFADERVYECQVQRLMKRVSILAELYHDKANLISATGCNTNLETDLDQLRALTEGFERSLNLFQLTGVVEDINRKNRDNSLCKLW
jgi:hypothetical protein